MFDAKLRQPLIDILSTRELSTSTLEVEKAHHHLGESGFVWNPTARPGSAEIGEIPPCRNQTIEAIAMAKHRFDCVVREIVSGEESRLRVLHALPRRCPISTRAGKRAAAIRVFLDANGQTLSGGHGGHLMQSLAFLQHVDEFARQFIPLLKRLRRRQSPQDSVAVHSADSFEKGLCLRMTIELTLEFRRHFGICR